MKTDQNWASGRLPSFDQLAITTHTGCVVIAIVEDVQVNVFCFFFINNFNL